MSRQPNYYRQILNVLEDIHKNHPAYNIGRHISTALDGSDIWAISDRDFLLRLKDYRAELDSDIVHEDDVDLIIKQGLDLSHILDEEEED
jgi:hypothetical protein